MTKTTNASSAMTHLSIEGKNKKQKKYSSNAEWTKIKNSKDVHSSRGMAEGVCDALMERYGVHTDGCEIRGHCLKAWVKEEIL